MTEIRDRLRDADPLLNEPSLPADEIAAMRRRVLDAVTESRRSAIAWKRTLAIAAAVALVAGAGVDSARPVSRPANAAVPIEPPTRESAQPTKTQVQFSTPGGTRIVWTIDPSFQLTEKR